MIYSSYLEINNLMGLHIFHALQSKVIRVSADIGFEKAKKIWECCYFTCRSRVYRGKGKRFVEYKESLQKSSELNRMIMHALSKLQIPANPITFALWYEFFLNRSEGLKKEIEEIINSDKPYTPDLGKRLFLRYIVTSDIQKLEEIEQSIFSMLNDVIKIVSTAGVDVSKFGAILSETTQCLTSIDDAREVRKVVEGIVTETQTMLQVNRQYEGKLKHTTEEIELLRKELSKVRQEASQDTLTGLANRKTFDETLADSITRLSRDLENVCLLMIDIDHFKNINDIHGHIIGDQVIRFVANTLKESVKGRDLIARYGGEEFAIILKNTPLGGAITLAEQIRHMVESSQLKQRGTGEPVNSVTISIGVESARSSDSAESLIVRADKALYHSKRTGRNKVTCLNPDYLLE